MIKIFIKFFRFSGKQKSKFYSALAISFIHAIFEALKIPAIAIVLSAVLENTISWVTVALSLGIMLVSIIGCSVSRRSMTMKQTVGAFTLATEKRIKIGERLKYMPMGYFNQNSLGTIISTTTTTAEKFQGTASQAVFQSLQGFLSTAVLTLAILFFDWRIGLLVLIGIIVFFGVNAHLQKKAKSVAPRVNQGDSALVGAALEYTQGIGVVRSYNLDQTANQAVDEAIKESEAVNLELERAYLTDVCLQSFLLKLFGVLIIMASILLFISGSMELITCMLMTISSFMIYGQLESAGNYSALLNEVDKSMDKMDDIFKTPVMDIDGKDMTPSSFDIKGERVSFSYDKQKIIDDVSFAIPQGTTTAIIGPSGGGKTTLCHLMARFWDADEGNITLGGKNLRDYTLDSLMANISMVFQSVYLFNDTIANNIKFGKPEAGMAEVIEASKKAYCHDFIIKLPQGYNTLIGESGTTISGGEKQRISIARALLKDAPIIILDEATANVDPENERLLQASIAELTRRKTVVMIAHRLKTVRGADQILVLDKGRIAQSGTHRELMAQGGLYADFVGMREESIGWKLGRQQA